MRAGQQFGPYSFLGSASFLLMGMLDIGFSPLEAPERPESIRKRIIIWIMPE